MAIFNKDVECADAEQLRRIQNVLFNGRIKISASASSMIVRSMPC